MYKPEGLRFNPGEKTIWVAERGFIDYRWWERQNKKGNYVISKTNSSVLYCAKFDFDRNDPVYAVVISNRLEVFTNNGSLFMSRIWQ